MKEVFGIGMDLSREFGKGFKQVYGMSRSEVRKLREVTGVREWTPLERLSERQWRVVLKTLGSQAVVGIENKMRERSRLENLYSRGSQRAIRLRQGLPVNGGRTRTNGKTARKLNPGRVRPFVQRKGKRKS